MIADIIQAVRNELLTLPDFKGVYIGEQTSIPADGYPICWIEGGFGAYGRGRGTLDEIPYISHGKVFDEIYNFNVWVDIKYEDNLDNSLMIYNLMDKVRDKLRNNSLQGKVYSSMVLSTEYPFTKVKEIVLRSACVYFECIAKRNL